MPNSSPPVSNTGSPTRDLLASERSTERGATGRNGKTWHGQFAAVVRWLHIYVSLLGFAALTFFAITGITLNHPTWFGIDSERVTEHSGMLNPEWLNLPPTAASNPAPADSAEVDYAQQVARLEVVEQLRASHYLRGSVSEFRVDERECTIMFKGPGYSADAFVNRETGAYKITEVSMGAVALINDLHKGRDTGRIWSWVIDVSALLTVFVSITGTILIFYIRRKRWSGLITAVAGTILLIVIYVCFVP